MTEEERRKLIRKLQDSQRELQEKLTSLEERIGRVSKRVRKPVRPPAVLANIAGQDEDIDWVSVGQGVWMCPAIYGIAPIAFTGHGSLVIGYMNAFAGNGPIEVNGYEVPPGYARWHLIELGNPPDSREATRAGRYNAAKHPPIIHSHHGLDMAGVKNANEPGGAGIYHTSFWATGCKDGVGNCLQLALGWANRMPIFRLRRDMWDDNVIAPHEFAAGEFQGMDRTRTYGPDGFAGTQKLDGYDALDHAHIVRMAHPAGVIARNYSFGAFLLSMLFQDVRASWFVMNRSDEKVNQHHWWSLIGMQRHYEHGVGCPEFGRAWAGALQILAWAIETADRNETVERYSFWPGEEIEDCLSMAIDAMTRMQDHFGWLYVIWPTLPSGAPSSRYKHKVVDEQWSHHIPEGMQPPVFKGFEQELVFLAIARLIMTGEPKCDALRVVADQLAVALRNDMETRQLMVVGEDEWSSDEKTSWQPYIYGYATSSQVDDQQRSIPWWSDNAANALWTNWSL
jgi:hypothetical protein